MGLVTCQGCGEIIGDKKEPDCPHCGTPIPSYVHVNESGDPLPKLVSCEDCGREVSRRAAACPHCGSPIGPAKEVPEQMRTSGGGKQVYARQQLQGTGLRTKDQAGGKIGCLIFGFIAVVIFVILFSEAIFSIQ